jgi:NCAIR mutase (PurE)-related protein
MSEVTLDFQRGERIGFDEAILCQGKSIEHLTEILAKARERKARFLLTRLSKSQLDGLSASDRTALEYEPISRTAYFGDAKPEQGKARIAVLAAGTSDASVTREIQRTLSWQGIPSTLMADVGVAGLWRLLDKVEALRQHSIAIVVAGMDAALPTVVGGLFGGVIIGVPTSTGYGVAEGGHTALNSILASCSPGVVTLNIDNGYGAACAAMRVLRVIERSTEPVK